MSNQPVQPNQPAEYPDADARVEIVGYKTDPLRRGYQILWNYESTYWRSLVGNDAWGLYEILRSFCHEKNPVCHPSIRLLSAILGLKEKRVLTGWTKKLKGKEYRYPGLIETLQQYSLVIAEVQGEAPMMRYVFHVNLTPGLLTEDQLAELPKILQKKHGELLARCEKAQKELEAKKRPPKDQKASNEGKPGGAVNYRPPAVNYHPGGGKLPPEHYPYNNTQENSTQENSTRYTTLETTSGIENHHSSGEPDPKTDVVVALTSHGLSKRVSQRLAKRYKRERIFEKIDYLEYLREHAPQKVKSPTGWLRRAIEENYSAPDGYKTSEQRNAEAAGQERRQQETARAVAAAEQEAEDLRRQEAEEQAKRLAHLQERYGTTQRELTLWPQALRELELQLPRATYQAWFPQTRLLSLTDGEALIAVPNSFTRDWLEQRLAGKILATLAGLALPVERLRFEVLTL
jgi:hypothetical protein